ncbi:Cell fate regulator YlbF, YheA/YmcA/DUF963 family (controls sporulation, competence, biofilm development) [Jeotgalicoccus aerolatus]|uniref:Cell fate regulator YlbF, YheA/YmcA/DUF963 family (Controls sporulation, competence, biofilm development) n=1 Tax=Jeotgalicoccus aerolatus TaxID=709510 RepID=A0A1G8W1D6_9STAP|nr:YlbF family regulator [Jeotgalicoccus aerolatus]SDJ72132.1 Cell fate regulator YlbF, YheA/YmcA/DUF963 family (controls sporulation, competence, biofilm development) [Jeotgalicoccus aerolatus]HJG33143.1 YlbF family regulator [Jeotgalicoccus aerolatus]
MLATMDFEIMDLLDSLNDMVMNTEEYKNYCKYKGLLDTDDEVRNMIKHFARLKEDFIDVERFGKYHPDFSSKRREINQYKKMLDMHPIIMEYRRAEFQLQSLLDEILFIVGQSVSPHANIVSSNPFFSNSSNSGCATGGSCSCAG